ncbi:phosphoadenosine phosphosulfate reductase family protein [Mycobacterium ostraviense]|uniref:phosphoadenosine phosphosulfate reductase domain-containing protein n=1 Tax=Mycobacterium ostraviense TaxID=2738409 RepID=UPI003B8A67FB
MSWGKDSTVTAHLVALAGLDIPLVRVRYDPWEMPETDLVRDAFLATHDVRYQERRGVAALSVRRGDAIEPESQRHINHLGEQINERYISGVRAEESTTRTLSMARHGAVTTNTCRPIARWTAMDVFAYLYREDLPVHPAYAMSCGGIYDRRQLRVTPLCTPMSSRGGVHTERSTWEDTYWPDITGQTRTAPR